MRSSLVRGAATGVLCCLSIFYFYNLASTTECPDGTVPVCSPEGTCLCALDVDRDGVPDTTDNCVGVFNPSQADFDGDGEGNACEADADGDLIPDEDDNCPSVPNKSQGDFDGDGLGDECDPDGQDNRDRDGDGVADNSDNCPDTPNPDQTDSDHDGWGDACEEDPDPTPTPTPTATPTPTPPRECSVYKVTAVGGGRNSTYGDVEALELSCLRHLADAGRVNWLRHRRGCNVIIEDGRFFTQQIHPRVRCGVVHPWNLGFRGNKPSGMKFLDRNCRVVSPPEHENEICASFTARYTPHSPISLIMDETAKTPHRLVQFPVNPGEQGKYFTWKGSKAWPLLVYDPENTGKITGSSQLFGDWTFGGKRTASLASHSRATKWRDGYEALGTLDQNGDQKISGEELSPISLWYDRNQDGISQDGEVVLMSDVGITELYYHSDSKDPISGDLYASLGYRGVKAGKEFSGRSVDWYSRSFTSPAEAMLSSSQMNNQEHTGEAKTSGVNRFSAAQLKQAGEGLLRIWEWKSKDADSRGRFSEGILVFEELDGPKIKGYSLTEIRLKAYDGYPARAAVVANPIEGELLALEEDGSARINFTIRNEEGRYLTRSTATFRPKDQALYGNSKAEFESGSSPDERLLVEYPWKAN